MVPFCSCYGSTTQTFKHVEAYFRRVILPPPPPDHFTVAAAPDTVEAGGTSALNVVARDSLGSEVAFTAATPVTLTLSDVSWGQLAYGGASGASVTAPYSAARAGGVSFVADTTTYCGFGEIDIDAAGGGIHGSAIIVVDGGSASALVGCEPCTRDACEPGVEGPQVFDPASSVRVREVGQVLTWGDNQSLTVQPLPIPLPPPRPDTTAGYTGPQFMLTNPVGGDTLDVGAGPHVEYSACMNEGRWVARINGLVVPIVPEEFVSRLDSVNVDGETYGMVDLRDLTEAHFRSLLANGSITRGDSLRLMLDIERERIGVYAIDFYVRVFLTPSSDPSYIDTTDVSWGDVYRRLVRPLLQDIRNYAPLSGTPRRFVYHSSDGVMLHERHHVPDVTRDLTASMDEWLAFADSLINGQFPAACAEEVVALLRHLANQTANGMERGYFQYVSNRAISEPHVYMELELEADAVARPTFQRIRERLIGTYIPNAIQDGLW